MAEQSPTLCRLPWTSMALKNNGDLRVCCHANVSPGGGLLLAEDGRTYNAGRDSLAEARNSPSLRRIRRQMLEGKWPEACVRCRTEEGAGLQSHRQASNDRLGAWVQESALREGTHADGSIRHGDFPLLDLDLRFGNLCNLKCRMCGPKDSSAWYGDAVALGGDSFTDGQRKVSLVRLPNGSWKPAQDDYGWHESEEFWRQLDDQSGEVREIYIVGGEPLLIRRHFDFLESLVRRGRASRVTINYNSNLTVIPDRALDLWRHFKAIKIGASIDGVGRVNDYLRFPSRFEEIAANLHRLDRAEGRYHLRITTTVSAYNILHLPELLRWRLEERFARVNRSPENHPLLTCHPVYKPECMSPQILPPAARKAVRTRFESFHGWLEGWLDGAELECSGRDALRRSARSLLDGYLALMEHQDRSHAIHKFMEVTDRLDGLRGECFAEVFPELAELIGWEKRRARASGSRAWT